MRYGVSLGLFVRHLNPTQHVRTLRAFHAMTLATEGASTPVPPSNTLLRLRVSASSVSIPLHHQLLHRVHVFLQTTSLDVTNTHQPYPYSHPGGYISNHTDHLPIVIDSGATISITPNVGDFVGAIEPLQSVKLQGLNGTTSVVGIGKVRWLIGDFHGVVREIVTTAYYVPNASIRLFSPQAYFKEQNGGSLRLDPTRCFLHLPDETQLEFPYNASNNLPFMLTSTKHARFAGVLRDDAAFLGETDALGVMLSVVDERNQNLSAAEKELLTLHQRFGHCNMQWVQSLAAKPRDRADDAPLISTKNPGVSGAKELPLCAACQLGKQRRRGTGSRLEHKLHALDYALKRGDVTPGSRVSIDQYQSTVRGRLPHTKGKEKRDDKYCGGTIFVDHATGFVFLRHQISLRSGETIKSKTAFEQVAREHGHKVHEYRADNHPFSSEEFVGSIDTPGGQTISYSGVGAHHQNGVAERAIQTITSWARTMMLHAILNWPDTADLELWPYAMDHAVWLWNHMPRRGTRISPVEQFSGSVTRDYSYLMRCHVWGCPVYVLDPKLQDGKKLPKWTPRSRRGQFLGFSPHHSSTVGRILNIQTGTISPQFHCVYDDTFTSVPNADTGGLFEINTFDAESWNRMIQSGHEKIETTEVDSFGRQHETQKLHDEWLTPQERQQRDFNRQRVRRQQQHIDRRAEAETRRQREPEHRTRTFTPDLNVLPDIPAPIEPHETLDTHADQSTTDFDDNHEAEPEPPTHNEDVDSSPTIEPQGLGRSKRKKTKNKFIFNDDFVHYSSTQKIRTSVLNDQFIQTLDWKKTTDLVRNADLRSMNAFLTLHEDVDLGTLEYMHPMALAANANSADNPRWEEAMNGPNSEGYWQAMEKELKTLVTDMDVWDVVDREPWMNVLPSTWAFKCKRFPDGAVKKLKARFCARGDKQIENVDYFETFSPVVGWSTVRLLLILTLLLGLKTTQVDYTAAFVHAPIDRDPNWDNMTAEERSKSGVFIHMPRGFAETGKVLKLKKSLYGLKQSPRNFFNFLKSKLEGIDFVQSDADPCLFVSDKVICLVYVDDTLLFSPKQEYIDEVLEQLKENEMDLEIESDVAGFLGVNIDYRADGTIEMTQKGLIKRIVKALDVEHLPIKLTPAEYGCLGSDPDGDSPQGTFNYASVIGMLQYLQGHSRPDITFAVSQCSRYIHRTRRSHELALIRIGQYLKGTMEKGMIIRPETSELHMECFVDADFAGMWGHENPHDPACVKSRTGYVMCISGCPIHWVSKMQSDIAGSTMEAEYNALSTAMKDLIPLLRLVKSVSTAVGMTQTQVTEMKTTVWEDNSGALTLANLEPGRLTPRSKFYAVRVHWFRTHLKPNNVVVKKIATDLQKADMLTKSLRTRKHQLNRWQLQGWDKPKDQPSVSFAREGV